MSVWRAREVKNIVTYGSARWATGTEVRAAGLLSPDGVVLGRFGRGYLRHDGPEHVLCFAPTRSGKGVALVIPTLLTWPGSVVVHDIKGENWTLTAGWRSRFGRVLRFDPTNPESSAYNPLLEVRRGDAEVRDVQNVADILVDPEGAPISFKIKAAIRSRPILSSAYLGMDEITQWGRRLWETSASPACGS